MTTFTEKLLVEDYIIERLKEKGWIYKKSEELEREDFSEPLLIQNLIKSIKSINKHIELTESDINLILAELKSKPTSMEGIKKILEFLKLDIPIKLEKTKELRYIQLIDYENIENNEFIVSNQVEFESPQGKRIPDIVLYVNGIPLVVIECKNPTTPDVSWSDAYNDIKNYYEKDIPELFKYAQFSIAAAERAKYFPTVLGSKNVKVEEWKKEGIQDSIDATLEMLSKNTLLDLIKNFIFVREERGETNKVITRWMQYEAANEVFNRVVNNLKELEKKNSGLIWHWQGSGKTLTMIFSAYKLYREQLLSNPTIFFVVDRDDLEEQLNTEFSSLDLPGLAKAEPIDSINNLKEVLADDEGRGKRGLFIVLIQKFREEEFSEFKNFLETKGESILNRKNVIGFVDEGHRTQYGKLAVQMRDILKNAFFFAFTGTPISIKGERDTYRTFSYPEENEQYLHKYFIKDSISDGFTVPIVFRAKVEKKINLDKELLDTFIEQDLEEIPEHLQEKVEKRVGRRLNEIIVRMKNPKRIEFITNDVVDHFKNNIDGKFKAMIVAVDRESCVIYKKFLDRLLPNYSEVVMTQNPKQDSEEIRNFFINLQKRYNNKQIWEIRKEIITKFKREEYPKILIVTDMLLTGFDAPNLQVMYLDKPLKGHKLLQAIARTNRPFDSIKEAGLIIDYVGILKEYERALAMYSKEDIRYSAVDIKEKAKEFSNLIKACKSIFKTTGHQFNRESLVKASRILINNERKSTDFIKNYNHLRKLFGFLGFNETKPYLHDFKWLTAVHNYFLKLTKRHDEELERYTKSYFEKTLKVIYESVEVSKILKQFPEIKIDENYLEKLKKTYPENDQRVYNMMFSLHRYVLVEKGRNPVYESIAEKVERIIKQWKERKLEMNKAYKELEKLIKNTVNINKREKQIGLSKAGYYMLLILEEKLGKSDNLLKNVRNFEKELISKGYLFRGWDSKQTIVKEVGRLVRKFLIGYKLPMKERDELHEKIIKGFKSAY